MISKVKKTYAVKITRWCDPAQETARLLLHSFTNDIDIYILFNNHKNWRFSFTDSTASSIQQQHRTRAEEQNEFLTEWQSIISNGFCSVLFINHRCDIHYSAFDVHNSSCLLCSFVSMPFHNFFTTFDLDFVCVCAFFVVICALHILFFVVVVEINIWTLCYCFVVAIGCKRSTFSAVRRVSGKRAYMCVRVKKKTDQRNSVDFFKNLFRFSHLEKHL